MKKTLVCVLMSTLVLCANATDKKNIATVNNEKITRSDVEKRLWRLFSDRALQDMIDEKLVLQEAKKLNIKASEKEVETRLNNIIASYASKEEFERNLKTVGLTEKDFKDEIRQQIIIRETVIAIKNVSVTEAEAKAFFERNKESLARPESVKLRQIFVNTKQEADDVHLALSAGADFAKLATLKSSDENLRKNSGDLGYVMKGTLVPEIEKEVFSLKPGEFTKPIQTGAGFSILKVEDLRPSEPANFESIKENIKQAMITQMINQKLPELIAELRQKGKIEITK